MNIQQINITVLILLLSFFAACNTSKVEDNEAIETVNASLMQSEENEEANAAYLSQLKFNSLEMNVDTLPIRNLSGIIKANGQLEVPPQHEATVTAILGANVTSIEVIEGDKVTKNQVLAYAAHPNLTNIQTQYVRTYEQMLYLEKEHARQQRLYEGEVGSGQALQKTQAEHKATVAEVKGYEAQLKQLSLSVEKIRNGNIYETVPIVSPIDGYIEDVTIQIGQYVEPQTELFMIVNNEHIHADLKKMCIKLKRDRKFLLLSNLSLMED